MNWGRGGVEGMEIIFDNDNDFISVYTFTINRNGQVNKNSINT